MTSTGPHIFHSVNLYDPQARLNVTFNVPQRYTQLQFINAGAQGAVASAFDVLLKQPVAIKKMHKPCCDVRIAKLAYREFVLLTSIQHPNIIRLIDAFSPQKNATEFEELYLVTELMDFSLHSVLQRKVLDHRELSFIVYQLLCAVNHLHNSGVIHRDLKPSNVVMNEDCTLKVLDFGLARKMNYDTAMRMSSYVVTRYYRAPEVIFEVPYTEKVDVWSIGCIFAELLLHRVLFKGNSSIDQWTKIVGVLGTPNSEFLEILPKTIAGFLRSLPLSPTHTMDDIIPNAAFLKKSEIVPHLTADNARDLLSHMLQIHPNDRYTVADCLNHPYVRTWFREEEVNLPASPNRYDDNVDVEEKTLAEWKTLLFSELTQFRGTRETEV